VSEIDPRTAVLLDRLAPAVAAGPDGWDDVITRSAPPRRWRLSRRRALVLALAVAALAAATAAGGVHGLVTRYLTGADRRTPLDIQQEFRRHLAGNTIGGVPDIAYFRPHAIRRVAHFSTPAGTFDFYVAPLGRTGSLCTLTVAERAKVVDDLCYYGAAGHGYAVTANDQPGPGVWSIEGRTPANTPIGSVIVRFQDGTTAPAARGPGWFAYLVGPDRLRAGHRPVGVDITGPDGASLRRLEFFPLCIKPVTGNRHTAMTSCDGTTD
jgi:hypothetical protein